MPRARDPLDVAGTCPDGEVQPRLEHADDSPHGADAQRIEPAALDPGNRLVGDTGEPGDVDLTQPAPDAESPQEGTHALVVHGIAMVALGPSLPLIR